MLMVMTVVVIIMMVTDVVLRGSGRNGDGDSSVGNDNG